MHGSGLGFPARKYFYEWEITVELLVEQVLTPPFVPVSDHSHELPRSVQRERTGSPR
jgi:hypothetical protein